MQVDQLHALWAAHDAKLDRSIRLNERLLRVTTLDHTRSALARLVRSTAISLIPGIVLAALTAGFIAAHVDEPRDLICGVAVELYLLGLIGSASYQLVLVGRVDYGGGVTAMQRTLERIRLVGYRAFTWALPAGVLVWVPALAVVIRALGGDLFAGVPLAWVVSNVLLGAVLLVIARWWSTKYVERPDMRPWARRLVDRISGRQLARAVAFLDELAAFERGE